MPGMDGFELCRILKKNEKLRDIPVIFLTAKNQAEDLAEGFKVGGVDYITKPFNRDELLIRVRNHLELSLSRKRIIEMNKSRDRLYSIIAHDIRSPFSNITFTINSIANGYLEPSSDEFHEIINHLEKTTNETLILLDNLLDWTKLQSDSISISPVLTNVSRVIMSCVQLLKGNADNKKITVNIDVSDDIMAFFDENTICAVFRNLIYNSIKFTPENGTIDINAQINAEFVKVSVIDTGIGMSEEVIRRIFVNNEHYTSRGTKNEQGSGLGSYIIKDFVEKNKGKIEVLSTLGKGTRILVYLPLINTF